MNNKEFLFLTKGRAVCLVLDTAIELLKEMDFKEDASKAIKDECSTEIFNIIVQVATISCGKDTWSEVYDFLLSIGISVLPDFHLEMMYMESISEKLPSEGKHN